MTSPLSIGLLLFPKLTQLDLTGPYEVFARAPGATVHLIAKSLDPVAADRGLQIVPTTTYASCPALDVICVPGGPGQIGLMDDDETLDFLRKVAADAKLITSVCTGSLVLGAAGLLRGYKATSHWSSLDQLSLLGATPVQERVVRDRNRITGAGVTSGIDFALNVVADLYGREVAEDVQFQLEYDPHPPFDAGSVKQVSPEFYENAKAHISGFIARRLGATERAAAKLSN
ncbi:class I glutamine amidotransferase-like protein [Myxozyma melibiosi]|uniref:Class I glutamine amidotransferase-like protein n=1 Tax=Myxozyma melibiosi TaxID=54550 RepID=A0ABR1F7L3_9ASCO